MQLGFVSVPWNVDVQFGCKRSWVFDHHAAHPKLTVFNFRHLGLRATYTKAQILREAVYH